MPPKRMTANPQKPARYRAGKPTGASSSSGSDSEASDAEVQQKQPEHKIAPPPKVPSAGKIVSNLGKVDLNARRREEEQEAEDRRKAAERAARAAVEQGFVTEDEEDEENDDDDDEEEESDGEEEESSEDEAPRRPLMLKPKFVPKSQRGAEAKDGMPKEDDEAARRKAEEEEEARRKNAMDELVEEQLRKDALARAAGKKHWDDQIDEDEDVDTEDDKDPEAEYAAWKLRELRRIKREREAIETREAERAEVERRRNLTEEERRAEDEEFLARQRAEKEGRGRMAYLQKYHHRGAFYRGDDEAEALASRDVMGARFEDDVANRELLPKALQLRDMTKLGRKGATRYRDLKTEDTGRWADFRDTYGSRRDKDRDRGGFDAYNVDERFKSDRERERGAGGASGPGGANAIPLGERKDVPGAPRGPRDSDSGGRRDNGDRYRDRDHERDRDRNTYRPSRTDDYDRRRRDDSRSRSRSKSPRRHHDRGDYHNSRKRDSSREAGRYESDKRRRIDAR